MDFQSQHRHFAVAKEVQQRRQLILSVDDEPAILTTREVLLESAGYKVLSAADGGQAVSLFARNPVDLVLLDFAMAGLNGGAVAQELKSRNAAVPIIIISGSPLLEGTIPCVDCIIPKGQGPELLLQEMDKLLTSLIDTTTRKQPSTQACSGVQEMPRNWELCASNGQTGVCR